jgi:hypothetical protein
MPIVVIDDILFDLDQVSPAARAHLEVLLDADERIKAFQKDLRIAQATRDAYANSIKGLLVREPNAKGAG